MLPWGEYEKYRGSWNPKVCLERLKNSTLEFWTRKRRAPGDTETLPHETPKKRWAHMMSLQCAQEAEVSLLPPSPLPSVSHPVPVSNPTTQSLWEWLSQDNLSDCYMDTPLTSELMVKDEFVQRESTPEIYLPISPTEIPPASLKIEGTDGGGVIEYVKRSRHQAGDTRPTVITYVRSRLPPPLTTVEEEEDEVTLLETNYIDLHPTDNTPPSTFQIPGSICHVVNVTACPESHSMSMSPQMSLTQGEPTRDGIYYDDPLPVTDPLPVIEQVHSLAPLESKVLWSLQPPKSNTEYMKARYLLNAAKRGDLRSKDEVKALCRAYKWHLCAAVDSFNIIELGKLKNISEPHYFGEVSQNDTNPCPACGRTEDIQECPSVSTDRPRILLSQNVSKLKRSHFRGALVGTDKWLSLPPRTRRSFVNWGKMTSESSSIRGVVSDNPAELEQTGLYKMLSARVNQLEGRVDFPLFVEYREEPTHFEQSKDDPMTTFLKVVSHAMLLAPVAIIVLLPPPPFERRPREAYEVEKITHVRKARALRKIGRRLGVPVVIPILCAYNQDGTLMAHLENADCPLYLSNGTPTVEYDARLSTQLISLAEMLKRVLLPQLAYERAIKY